MSWASAVAGGQGAGTASWLLLRAKAVPEMAGGMLAILRDVLLDAQLDNAERIGQMIRETKASMEAQLVPAGHVYAGRRLRAGLCEADWVSEQIHGIENLRFLRGLAEDHDGTEQAIAAFARLRDAAVTRPAMVCNVTADGANLDRFAPELARFLGDLPNRPARTAVWPAGNMPAAEGLTIPAKVNYVAKGENLYRLGHAAGGAERVARKLTNTAWLWEKVRVQGGAYGGGCTFDRHSGNLTFWSYRDPNILRTLENFDGTAAFLRTLDVSEAEMVRAQIGVIGEMDMYMLPDTKGLTSLQRHLTGDSDEERQILREEVLSATLPQIRAVADAYADVAAQGRVAILGAEDAISSANAERGGEWLAISKVM
jgi:presequence protease